jgi:hypothetical protein
MADNGDPPIQFPRPRPVDERPLQERAADAYAERVEAIEEQVDVQKEGQARYARELLTRAYGGDPDEWQLEDAGPVPEDNLWITYWRNGDVRLVVRRIGTQRSSPTHVDLIGSCDEHGIWVAVQNVPPALADLGECLELAGRSACPTCEQQDAAERVGLDRDDHDLPPDTMIGRIIIAAIQTSVRSALAAEREVTFGAIQELQEGR